MLSVDLVSAFPDAYAYGQRVANELIDTRPADVNSALVLAIRQLGDDRIVYIAMKDKNSLGEKGLARTRGFYDTLSDYRSERGE